MSAVSIQLPLKFKTSEDPVTAREIFSAGRVFILAEINLHGAKEKLSYGQTLVYTIINAYWNKKFAGDKSLTIPALFKPQKLVKLNDAIKEVAVYMGETAATLDVTEASYLIGNIYTSILPEETRTTHGVYYTPPNLTAKLIDLAEKAGVNWETATVLDPACGGGAFLAPVALRMVSSLKETDSGRIIEHVEQHLHGFEIDPFSAWMSQVLVEAALSRYSLQAGRRPKVMVEVKDSLDIENSKQKFDLIIGNPPYGKIKLSDKNRQKFVASLYGHANLYGLFVQLAFELVNKDGVIAFVTPTGFLGGEYFKKLREFICVKGRPVEFDFIYSRKGIFEDVLQETMLTTYRADADGQDLLQVNEIIPSSDKQYEIKHAGVFSLPSDYSKPWIISRNRERAGLVQKLSNFTCTLKDWGYEVKTGPLVWNRHKGQLTDRRGKNNYPLIWAEAITLDNRFIWRAAKKNHTLFFTFKKGDEWLLTNESCIILQRTTAKEQERRLIPAIIPEEMMHQQK